MSNGTEKLWSVMMEDFALSCVKKCELYVTRDGL